MFHILLAKHTKTMTMLTNAPVAVLAPIKVDSLLLVDKTIMHMK